MNERQGFVITTTKEITITKSAPQNNTKHLMPKHLWQNGGWHASTLHNCFLASIIQRCIGLLDHFFYLGKHCGAAVIWRHHQLPPVPHMNFKNNGFVTRAVPSHTYTPNGMTHLKNSFGCLLKHKIKASPFKRDNLLPNLFSGMLLLKCQQQVPTLKTKSKAHLLGKRNSLY